MTVSCFSEMSPSIFSSNEPLTLYYLDPASQILMFQACTNLSDIFFSWQRKRKVDSEGIAKIYFPRKCQCSKGLLYCFMQRYMFCHISPEFTAVLTCHDLAPPFPENLILGKLISMWFSLFMGKMNDERKPRLWYSVVYLEKPLKQLGIKHSYQYQLL